MHFLDIEHRRDEHAGVQSDRFSRLEEHLDPVFTLELADQVDEKTHVVPGLRDVMAAAEIHPLHLVQPRCKALFDHCERSLERVGTELAQRVEVQALDAS